jgi:formate dehydrogenase major subunit
MKQTVNITIDGQAIEAKAGQTILEAATAAGIDIPTLCHHPALKPIGACRVCLVEISKHQPLYPACTYEVTEGLAVTTHNERVDTARRFVLDMLFSERNHYCMYCELSGNCELQDLGYRYGLDHWVYPTYLERFPVDASRDTFLMDHNRCVLCRRCVRACSELVANHTLGMRQRGAKTMISADLNVPFADSSCISCGTCLQVCPTGALLDKRSAYMDMGHRVQLERIKSSCSQCSVGCGIEIVTRGGNVVRVEGDWDASPNGGVLCHKGRFDPLHDQRVRITNPMVRRSGSLEAASWNTALATVATRLATTPANQVGVLTSVHATNEALWLASSLFHQGLGVHKTGLLDVTLKRLPGRHGALDQIPAADLLLVVGANPVEEQPVVSFLVKRAVDQGVRLILVDGLQNPLAPFAHMTLEKTGIGQAIQVARRAEAPVVLYGSAADKTAHAALAQLEHATFVALDLEVNSRAAVAHGLDSGFDGSNAQVVYTLLGDQTGNGRGLEQVPASAFLVVQASYRSPWTDRADVVLPTAIWSERSGTFVNLEGSVCQVRQAVEPAGEAKADWEILSLLAQELGKGPGATLEELSTLAAQGLDYKEAL